ncbi:hypothetical protein M153_2120001, partial [Pseudoloma neurophilia]
RQGDLHGVQQGERQGHEDKQEDKHEDKQEDKHEIETLSTQLKEENDDISEKSDKISTASVQKHTSLNNLNQKSLLELFHSISCQIITHFDKPFKLRENETNLETENKNETISKNIKLEALNSLLKTMKYKNSDSLEFLVNKLMALAVIVTQRIVNDLKNDFESNFIKDQTGTSFISEHEHTLFNILLFTLSFSQMSSYKSVGQAVTNQILSIIAELVTWNKESGKMDSNEQNLLKNEKIQYSYILIRSLFNKLCHLLTDIENSWFVSVLIQIVKSFGCLKLDMTVERHNFHKTGEDFNFVELLDVPKQTIFFNTTDTELQKKSLEFLSVLSQNGYKDVIDMDYILFWYERNEKMLMNWCMLKDYKYDNQVLSEENSVKNTALSTGSWPISGQEFTLRTDFLPEISDYLKLIPLVVKGLKNGFLSKYEQKKQIISDFNWAEGDLELHRQRLLFLLLLVRKFSLQTLNVIENFLVEYCNLLKPKRTPGTVPEIKVDEEFDYLIMEIMAQLVHDGLKLFESDSERLRTNRKTKDLIIDKFDSLKIDFTKLNERVPPVKEKDFCHPENDQSNDKEIQEQKSPQITFSGGPFPSDIQDLLLLLTENYPIFAIETIKDCKLDYLWCNVLDTLVENHLILLFDKQKKDLHTMISKVKRIIKEMYFKLNTFILEDHEYLKNSKLRNPSLLEVTLLKLSLYNAQIVLLDAFKRNCGEFVIIEYLKTCQKKFSYDQISEHKSDTDSIISQNEENMTSIEKNLLMLQTIHSLMLIKPFEEENSLNFIFDVILGLDGLEVNKIEQGGLPHENMSSILLKFKILLLIQERSIRHLQILVKIIILNVHLFPDLLNQLYIKIPVEPVATPSKEENILTLLFDSLEMIKQYYFEQPEYFVRILLYLNVTLLGSRNIAQHPDNITNIKETAVNNHIINVLTQIIFETMRTRTICNQTAIFVIRTLANEICSWHSGNLIQEEEITQFKHKQIINQTPLQDLVCIMDNFCNFFTENLTAPISNDDTEYNIITNYNFKSKAMVSESNKNVQGNGDFRHQQALDESENKLCANKRFSAPIYNPNIYIMTESLSFLCSRSICMDVAFYSLIVTLFIKFPVEYSSVAKYLRQHVHNYYGNKVNSHFDELLDLSEELSNHKLLYKDNNTNKKMLFLQENMQSDDNGPITLKLDDLPLTHLIMWCQLIKAKMIDTNILKMFFSLISKCQIVKCCDKKLFLDSDSSITTGVADSKIKNCVETAHISTTKADVISDPNFVTTILESLDQIMTNTGQIYTNNQQKSMSFKQTSFAHGQISDIFQLIIKICDTFPPSISLPFFIKWLKKGVSEIEQIEKRNFRKEHDSSILSASNRTSIAQSVRDCNSDESNIIHEAYQETSTYLSNLFSLLLNSIQTGCFFPNLVPLFEIQLPWQYKSHLLLQLVVRKNEEPFFIRETQAVLQEGYNWIREAQNINFNVLNETFQNYSHNKCETLVNVRTKQFESEEMTQISSDSQNSLQQSQNENNSITNSSSDTEYSAESIPQIKHGCDFTEYDTKPGLVDEICCCCQITHKSTCYSRTNANILPIDTKLRVILSHLLHKYFFVLCKFKLMNVKNLEIVTLCSQEIYEGYTLLLNRYFEMIDIMTKMDLESDTQMLTASFDEKTVQHEIKTLQTIFKKDISYIFYSYLHEKVKYMQLADSQKRDRVVLMLELIKKIINKEKEIFNIIQKSNRDEIYKNDAIQFKTCIFETDAFQGISKDISGLSIELLKIHDSDLTNRVYRILKMIF